MCEPLVTLHHITAMSDGQTEGYVASILLDKDDPTRLSYAEIKEGWGSCTNFVASHGLKPYDEGEILEALEISRQMKESDNAEDDEQ